jgi:hypothetical protein
MQLILAFIIPFAGFITMGVTINSARNSKRRRYIAIAAAVVGAINFIVALALNAISRS